MTTTTHWHDGNLNINSDIDRREINQYATSEYDVNTVGANILDGTGWTTTGWSGSYPNFTHDVPTDSQPLSKTLTITPGKTYYLTVRFGYGDDLNITLGGVTKRFTTQSFTDYLVFTAATSGGLSFTAVGTLSSVTLVSLTELTIPKKPIYNIYNTSGSNVFSISSCPDGATNTFLGNGTGVFNTTGYYNVGLGKNALHFNIRGRQNIAIGDDSLYNNTTGLVNIGIGYQSLYTNMNGNYNVAIGPFTLYDNISGIYNVAFGYGALQNNISGNYNTGIGYLALDVNTLGQSNIAFGATSLQNNTIGSTNIAIGGSALNKNTTGTNNVAFGENAGSIYGTVSSNLNSTYSIFIGPSTKAAAANGVNEIVIGYQATGNGSNTVTLGHTDITKTYLRGDIYPVDAKNIVLGTTTGMKIGTATTQKIGFFNATPIVQVVATTDLGTVLSNLGLRAAGTAYPITTSGNATLSGVTRLGGASAYLETNATGDTFWVGAGTGLAYGSFYGNELGVTYAVNNSYMRIADTGCVTGEVNLVTYTDAGTTLTISKAGKYRIGWAVSAEANLANAHVLAGIMIDSTTVLRAEGRNHFETSTANKQQACSGTAIISCPNGTEVIGVGIGSDGNTTLTVDHVNLSITQVGG